MFKINKKYTILFLFFTCIIVCAQPPEFITRTFSKPKEGCRYTNLKVKDVRPATCNLEDNCNLLYPVFIEEFDNNYDLPNKWFFGVAGIEHDDLEDENEPGTWYGDAYFDRDSPWPHAITNRNLKLNNGIATFSFRTGAVTRNNKTYPATSANIQSLSNFRTGVFEARIKLPTANKLWPAFWLLNAKSLGYTEIDIFEFYDDEIDNGICDTYNLMRMSLHTGSTSEPSKKRCQRADKYPIDINDWHTYKLIWNDYEIKIYVDGLLLGYATKYFEGTYPIPDLYCGFGYAGHSWDARRNYSCNELSNLPDNLLPTINYGPRPRWLPNFISWPPPQPYLANTVDVHFGFPDKYNSMNLIIGNQINRRSYLNNLETEFANYASSELDMEVDWIKVYQPFCCGINKTICSLNDLENQTYNTDILTGKNIQIGYPNETCEFAQNKPNPSNWSDIPVILLATDEIAIYGEAAFPGDTYAEMRMVDCGRVRKMDNGDEDDIFINTLPNNDVYQKQLDSIANNYYKQTMDSLKNLYAKDDIQEITITPSPVSDEFNILTDELIFNAIKSIYLIDINGKVSPLQKNYTININNYMSGSYILRLDFEDGATIYKKIVKL